ncbi:hypothetical protein LAZ67_5001354 [Cordylochernes scorpioides]|uniref:Reverse transcriptase zinc-binding domain-containing protein n=1 Tax=Cordylochernes scorpioides TaxID=51811 RepID=A0ABY6KHD7_9ARAC|nr:hypothetical protein LAZ67_5001354 [Cordylochernes scorpioides]
MLRNIKHGSTSTTVLTGHGYIQADLATVSKKDPTCPHCQDEDQTVDHLLFTCPTFQYQRFQTATLLGIEQNPGPPTKRQTTLTAPVHSGERESIDGELKMLILNMAAEIKSLGERIDIRLTKIETRMDDWNMRFCNMEEKLTKCIESQQATEKLASCNSLKEWVVEVLVEKNSEKRNNREKECGRERERVVLSHKKNERFGRDDHAGNVSRRVSPLSQAMSGSSGQPNLYEVPVDDGFGRRQDGQVVIFVARSEDPGLQKAQDIPSASLAQTAKRGGKIDGGGQDGVSFGLMYRIDFRDGGDLIFKTG